MHVQKPRRISSLWHLSTYLPLPMLLIPSWRFKFPSGSRQEKKKQKGEKEWYLQPESKAFPDTLGRILLMSHWPENLCVVFSWAYCFTKQIQGSTNKEDKENCSWVGKSSDCHSPPFWLSVIHPPAWRQCWGLRQTVHPSQKPGSLASEQFSPCNPDGKPWSPITCKVRGKLFSPNMFHV